jgi:hypothetical protein
LRSQQIHDYADSLAVVYLAVLLVVGISTHSLTV